MSQRRLTTACLLLLAGLPARADGLPLPDGAVRRFGSDRCRIPGSPLASALSPAGTRLAVLSSARCRDQVILTQFDAANGRPAWRSPLDDIGAFASPRVAFSADARYVAAAVSAHVRAVWASDSGALVARLPPARVGGSLCQFTPEGLLALTAADHTDLYAVPSGKLAKRWSVGAIARLTADARMYARVDREFGSVGIGAPTTGRVAGTLPVKTADNSRESGLAFSPDGKVLAVVHDRRLLQLWDTATRKKLCETAPDYFAFNRGEWYYAVAFDADGGNVYLQTKAGTVERWRVRGLTRLPTLHARGADYIGGVGRANGGRTVLAVADSGLIHRWDAATGRPLPHPGYNDFCRISLGPHGSPLAVGDSVWRIDLWDVATGQLVRRLDAGAGPSHALVSLAFSPDGRRLAVGEGHCDIWLLPTDGGRKPRRVSAPLRLDGGWMHFLAWAPDGTSLFADGSGMTLCRINLADGKDLWTVGDENMPSFALSPDGRSVAKALCDSIQFLDAATGKERSNVPVAGVDERKCSLRAVTFAPDGKRLALVVGPSTVVLCDGTGGELRRMAAGGRRRWPLYPPPADVANRSENLHHLVHVLAFSPDGKWLVSGADDFSVRVWEVATGKLVRRYSGHDGTVEQLAVAPDGHSVFSAGQDGFVYQWDLTPRAARTGQRRAGLWAAAADADPAAGVRAAWALVTGSAESRAFVADKLPPAMAARREDIARWLADLDAPRFAARESASRALRGQGRKAAPYLREAFRTTASPETRRRAERLLAAIENDAYTAEELRVLRLVQACELSGSASARALLRRWAGGAAGALLTDDAKAALGRLGR
jgi:WD40 repeat protein